MKVIYIGSKDEFRAHGYFFSYKNKKTVDVPEHDKEALRKFIGNRYFFVPHPENTVAPKFYVREIKTIPIGGLRKPIKKRNNINVFGGWSVEECQDWIKSQYGQIDVTHYIVENDEKISREHDGEAVSPDCVGLFRKKGDGSPRAKPDKIFEGPDAVEQANSYMEENSIDPAERVIMCKDGLKDGTDD